MNLKYSNTTNNKISVSSVLFFLFLIWIGNRIGNAFYIAYGKTDNVLDCIFYGLDHIYLFKNPIPSFNIGAIIGMAILPFIAVMVAEYQKANRKNFRQKEEHGSARYGKFHEIDHLRDK